jgi:hypothetical protein
VQQWSTLAPWSLFREHPHEDAQNPPDPARVVEPAKVAPRGNYDNRAGKYCPGGNMNLHAIPPVPIDGVLQSVQEHQCYQKCVTHAPCEGDDCFCDGLLSGYDDAASNAICGDQALCQYLCDNLEDCTSIDMSTERSRCFLNSGVCSHEDDLAVDPGYTLMRKAADPNRHERRLNRQLLQPLDHGYSWDDMLRFKPIRVANGGTFKVCFCDAGLLAENAVCGANADYSIEVGTLHASGVACLLERESLQRASCVEQEHGGLRCYDREAPQPAAPMLASTQYELEQQAAAAAERDTYCSLLPEEEARAANCQTSSGFHSAN